MTPQPRSNDGNAESLSPKVLRLQNRTHAGTGGASAHNREKGFVPAFIDRRTGRVYRARFADGLPAPMHLLDGLPQSLVASRDTSGRVARAKDCVEAGFLYGSRFYTRSEAARAVE